MPELSEPPRVLAIHAHPDDIEFQCAGTLALLKQKGCSISMIVMTPGDCGSAEIGPEEISEIRRTEARRSAELLGADFQCLEFRDLSIVFDNESRRRVTEAVRQSQPNLIITAPPIDYMFDHEMTSQLVRDACFTAPLPNYATQAANAAAPLEQIPYLYYTDPIEGLDHFGNPIFPGFVLDISESADLKFEMLACHDSQRAWLRRQHGMDEYIESGRRWSAKRGAEIGVAYGEAFTQHKGHPYPNDNLLLKIIGQ